MSTSSTSNVLIIMSDEHTRRVAGCYGNTVVRTPNIDRLAQSGTRFDAAYAPSPICVPSRSSFATGRYVHDLQLWDNNMPYTGAEAASWGQRLTEQGHHVTTIGKLHFAESTRHKAFPDQRIPIYVSDNIAIGLLRGKMPVREGPRRHVERAGAGESEYIGYDRAVADEAVKWLQDEAKRYEAPWVLYVSFVTPHFPLLAPEHYFGLYPQESVPLPTQWKEEDWPRHPALDENRRLQSLDEPLTEQQVRKAVAAYYGLVTFMDEQVGRVLAALEDMRLAETTRVLYTSDHGESLGAHGLWWKHNMYENSVGIPLIASGPGVPQGRNCKTPVSLTDIFTTVVPAVGASFTAEDSDLPGASLFDLALSNQDDRTAFSEYHDAFSTSGIFMVRKRNLKYIEYIGFKPQLFDLAIDPDELNDLGSDIRYTETLAQMERELHNLVDPNQIDLLARTNQDERIRVRGGVEEVIASWEVGSHGYTPVPNEFHPQNLK